MKRRPLIWTAALLAASLTVVYGHQAMTTASNGAKGGKAQSKTGVDSAFVTDTGGAIAQVATLMDAGNYTAAEALVDQKLSDPSYGAFMAVCKAELLQKRSENTASLDLYMQVIAGNYGEWCADSTQLKTPMDLAILLNRSTDADTIATQIIANQASAFYGDDDGNGPLMTPTSATTATERKAYALLVLGLDAGFAGDAAAEVSYCLQAQALLSTSTVVHAHLAAAYSDRNQTGDAALGRTELSQAYQQEPIGSDARVALQDLAAALGHSPLP